MLYLVIHHRERYPCAEAFWVEFAKNEVFDRNHDLSLAENSLLVEFGAKAHKVIEDKERAGDWNAFSMIHTVEFSDQN